MQVSQLTIDPLTRMPVLILKDATGERSLPVWIGLIEASAIATELEQLELSRQAETTHDLIASLLDLLEVKVLQVRITDLKEQTYFASIQLQQAGRVLEVDTRASDAIAVALRQECEILVEEQVIERASELDLTLELHDMDDEERRSFSDLLARLPDEVFGKWKM
jgi:bifunctional DNase/RNase